MSLTEKSKFVMEVVQNEEEKRYLTFQKKSGSFMVARDIWTGIQENVKLQEWSSDNLKGNTLKHTLT